MKNLTKLIDVKSIVTLTLTAVFAVLAVNGSVSAEQFLTVFTVIISFFFGTKYGKTESNNMTIKTMEEKGYENLS